MTAELEEVKPVEITQWLTLNTATSPTKLQPGETPDSNNVWVDEKPGSVISSPGTILMGVTPSNLPSQFAINFFRTAAGTQTFVVSDGATVWTTVDFKNYTSIITGLSSSFQLRGLVARDKLWLTNGTDAVRVFDGTTVTVLDGSGSTPNVPKGRYIAYHDERVWIGHTSSARSAVYFSALTDSSATIIAPDNASAWPSSNFLQISEGDADFMTAIKLYRGYLHFFKQYSIWRLAGYDEYTYTRVKTRASTGTRFNESIQELDSLIHLIGVDGIYTFDGEDAERISDIIDPATASQTAFGFNQLQQPAQNNQFWETNLTSDWNLGTVPANVFIDDALSQIPIDDTQADFQAGAIQMNVDSTSIPGSIVLSRDTTGGSADRIGAGINAYLDDSNNGATVYGSPMYLTDGNNTRETGLGIFHPSNNRFVVDLSADQSTHYDIGRITLINFQSDTNVTGHVQVNTGTYQTKYGTQGTWVEVGTFGWRAGGVWIPLSGTIDFGVLSAIQVSVLFTASTGSYQMAEIQVFKPAYKTIGTFVSKTIDYGSEPNSYGVFTADCLPLDTHFFTQSSDNGTVWDAEADVRNNGSAVTSIVRRYLRWGYNFTSDGTTTTQINSVTLGSVYISAIHDTGGGIFSWGAFEADYTLLGGLVNFFYRTATTSGGIASATWRSIVPGGAISDSVANQFIQFKIEMFSAQYTVFPYVTSVTINWVTGTASQPQTLQNVSSAYWRNRYWLSAAGPGATSNDTVLVRGKKTFKSPWQLKRFNFLSFARFQDALYATSSVDGSIYRVDSGYSNAGVAIDSYFQTGDFSFGGFYINPLEILIEVERMGSYDLNVGVSIDRGNTWIDYAVDLTVSSFAPSYWKKINIDSMTTDRIRFRVRTNGIDQPFQVHNLYFFYTQEKARGSIK